jgi:outer membrane receptor for ferrienterochelin and colicins
MVYVLSFKSIIMKKYIIIFFFLYPFITYAQKIKGTVKEIQNNKESPLPGVTVSLMHTGFAAITDVNGEFEITADSSVTDKRVIVSLAGYSSDTVAFTDPTNLKIILKPVVVLKAAEVTYERSGTITSINTIKTEIITTKELKKAACCNLGESFETNATVDVTYKDAITGSREIQVLGLSGAYTQLLTENAPLISGLGLTYGLNGIPGTQIDAINIVKGPGSVIFGPESISGMVNVDLKDPEKAEKIFINGFVDENLRKEINIDKGVVVARNVHSLVSFHADQFNYKIDENGDSFLDMPMLTNISLLNKWKFNNGKGLMSQNSIKYLFEERMGGQVDFDYRRNDADLSAYGQKLKTNRIELYGRTGYVIPSATYNSIGFQYSYVNHQQKGFYGLRKYEGEQNLTNLRLIYNRELNKYNSMNIGVSMNVDLIDEQFDTLILNKEEIRPGVFIENTFKRGSHFTLITGVRADQLNDQIYITPRANLKYSITEKTDVRLTGGYGLRTANILAENPAILLTSKEIIIREKLEPERAYNFGANFNHEFMINYRKGTFGVDVYRTVFENKIIPDFDTDPLSVYFYNTKNNAFSNNLQVEVSYKILKTVELKLAYKYLDVYSIRNNVKVQDAYIAKHRGLANLYFESFNQKWKANLTAQIVGEKRLPKVSEHLMNSERTFRERSPAYVTFNTQVTRVFRRVELYAGAENIFDFKQNDHLLGSDDPYGPYFDASYIWGPMDGRKIYAGFRYKISR